MTEHPSPFDRLEARVDAQAARIDELYRLLQAVTAQPGAARPRRRRPRRRHAAARL